MTPAAILPATYQRQHGRLCESSAISCPIFDARVVFQIGAANPGRARAPGEGMTIYLVLLLAGIASGFLAGLLGIGGGFVMVPIFILVLPALGVDPALIPKVAVATSLAAMIPTACSAVVAQYRRGTLDIGWVRRLTPAAAIGAAIGSQLAAVASGRWVAIAFAIYASCVALTMLRGRAVEPNGVERTPRAVPTPPATFVGVLIGAFASIAGVGGASFTVPFLLSARVEIKRALAVSSAVGLAIAVAGAASFATAWSGPSTCSALVGLVHWPAALMIAVSATLLAPSGVSAAHMLPAIHLKRAFAALLVAACGITLSKAANPNGVFDDATSLAVSAVAVRN